MPQLEVQVRGVGRATGAAGVAHVADHRAGADRIAGIAGHAARNLGRGIERGIAVAHRLILGETAGIDKHAKGAADADRLAVDFGDDAGDLATLDDQFLDRGFDANIGTGFQRGLEHAALQRGAGGHIFLAGEDAEHDVEGDLEEDLLDLPALLHERQLHAVIQLGIDLQEALAQPGCPFRTEFLLVEGHGGDAAARLAAAGQLVIIIRPELRRALQLHALFHQKVDHFRRIGDIGDALFMAGAGQVFGDGVEIGDALFGAFILFLGGEEAVVRHPDHAARLGGGAADERRFFEDQHRLAGLAQHQCRAHRTGAAADHYKVEDFIEIAHATLSLTASPAACFGDLAPVLRIEAVFARGKMEKTSHA